ncbi:MAG: 2-isopropylmalate synthase [Candidatus Micrarchaeota archaeon]|nr:2-isopropylmalate synthase [Candidatus Micrarchaeota archaeon]
MRKYSKLIRKGIFEPLPNVQFHGKAPLKRFLLLDSKLAPNSNMRVAAHIITKLPKRIPKYCQLHYHKFDEINLILSEKGKLKYRVCLEDEEYTVSSPATVYIPKGMRHSQEVISGHGIFVVILMAKKYKALI